MLNEELIRRFSSIVIIMAFMLLYNAVFSQQIDSIGASEIPEQSKYFGGHYGPMPKYMQNRNDIRRVKEWKWENLGPNEQPAELNPGGKALPEYSKGRGNGTGRINFLFVHPKKKNKVWACSPTGGLWFTTDGGENWMEGGTDQLPISGTSSVAVNPKNARQWVVSTGDGDDVFKHTDGLWRTKDSGKTYENINGTNASTALPFGQDGDYYSQICEVVCHPRKFNFLIAATDHGLWLCEDASDTESMRWKRVAEGHFYDVDFIRRKNGPKNLIVAGGSKLMLSNDDGQTWNEVTGYELYDSTAFPFVRINPEWSAGDPDKLYCAITCSQSETMSSIGDATLQVYDLRTGKWEFIRSLKKDMNNVIPTRGRAFDINPIDPSVMMCGNVQPLYRSTDGGKSFQKIEKNQMHDDCHHIEFWKDGKTVWASHDGGVSNSNDGGITWQTRDKGIGAANVFGLSVAQTLDPQVAYGAYDTGGNLLKDNKWWHVNWGDGFQTITHPENPNIVFVTRQNGGINKSVDGQTFEESIGTLQTKTEWHTWIRMHPADHNMIFCSGSKLVRSRDLGKSWEPILDVADLGDHLFNVYRFFMSNDHVGVMYTVVLNNKEVKPEIWRTFNVNEPDPSKIKWEKITDIPVKGWISSIEVDPIDPYKCWILFSNRENSGKIWYFNNNEYVDETRNLGNCQAEVMILQKGNSHRLYLGSDYGVFTRSKGETEWTLLTGLPGVSVRGLAINYKAKKIVAGTFGRGVWIADLVD